MQVFLHWIDMINERLAKILSYVILVIIVILCYEVFKRYILNSPTIWVSEISGRLFGMYSILGGGYVLLN